MLNSLQYDWLTGCYCEIFVRYLVIRIRLTFIQLNFRKEQLKLKPTYLLQLSRKYKIHFFFYLLLVIQSILKEIRQKPSRIKFVFVPVSTFDRSCQKFNNSWHTMFMKFFISAGKKRLFDQSLEKN